jgi:hypothetical protein
MPNACPEVICKNNLEPSLATNRSISEKIFKQQFFTWHNYFHFHSNIDGEYIKNRVGSLLPSSSYFSLYECKSWLSLHRYARATPEWFECRNLLEGHGWQSCAAYGELPITDTVLPAMPWNREFSCLSLKDGLVIPQSKQPACIFMLLLK